MKAAFVLVALCLVGCSGSKDPESNLSPEVREFKAATKRFLSECQVAINASERGTEFIGDYISTADRSYMAINEIKSRAASQEVIKEGKRLIDDLWYKRFDEARGRMETIQKNLDSMK